MNREQITPYRIITREDGLIDLLFPREGRGCPCHDRVTIQACDGLEEDVRRNYDAWRQRARDATDDRADAMAAFDQEQAKGEVKMR